MTLRRKRRDTVRNVKTNQVHRGNIERFLSIVLCLVMLIGHLQAYPAIAFASPAISSVTIQHEGETIEKLILPENERARLTAECDPASDGIDYQWQILADPQNETWVNIYDGTSQQLALSYALVQSLLDASGSVYIRCKASLSGDSCVSSPVCVTMEYIAPIHDSASTAEIRQVRKNAYRTAASETGDEKMVSIVINYLDGVSGLPIYSAYTGYVNVSQEAYKANVISPTYLGYAPKYNADNPAKTLPDPSSGQDFSALFPDKAETITLDIPVNYAGTEYVVNVYYFAIDVPYAVRFYFQNIHDDLYTEDVTKFTTALAKTGTIISNEKLAELAGNPIGFTKLYHYPEAVAADGSTVFECYYDRNYYMLKFDTNGGYGTEPIYARYGTPFLVNEPVRHGYVFRGWERLNEDGTWKEEALPSTVPAESRTYRAIWETADTTYDVAYWLQNADDDGYSYIGTCEVEAKSDTTVTPANAPELTAILPICGNHEPDHTTHNDDCYAHHAKHYILATEKNKDISITVKGDGSSVLNVYYTRKYYTLRFIYAKQNGSTYSVVGGSTYGFGNKNQLSYLQSNPNYNLNEILDNRRVPDWGEIEELPTPKSLEGAPQGTAYVKGTYQSGSTSYYYLEITARYGADLTNLWPTEEVFGKVKVKNPSSHTANKADQNTDNDGWGNYAYLAGWNGEFKVQYSISHDNSTIKGLYQNLDDTVLFGSYNGPTYNYPNDRQIETQTTVGGAKVDSNACYFLAFFDNGANVSWSVPREWIYELFVPVLSHEVETGSELYDAIVAQSTNPQGAGQIYTTDDNVSYYYHNSQIYRLYKRVVTSDDNPSNGGVPASNSDNGQTQTTLMGFNFDEKDSTRYEQFKNKDTDDGRKSYTSRFFYKRDTFTIKLHNHGEVYNPPLKSPSREFESLMDDYMTNGGKLVEPPYPKTLEENAYYFDGWYASPECVEGTHYVDGRGYKMPAVNVVLYAKWAPKTHTVKFFRTHADLLRYEADNSDLTAQPMHTYDVKHGQVLDQHVDTPSDPYYSFGGWFYDYNGKRYAYTPLDTPVVRDLNVFAAWGSLSAQPYRIHYALDVPETESVWTGLLEAAASAPKDNVTYTVTDGTNVRTYVYLASDGKFHRCIADDTEGFAYQGSTRTFTPKVGDPYNQLYANYNKGYYPTLASHSITMEYEESRENLQKNVFTFTYVHKETVDYRVEYRYADTKQLIESVPTGGIKTASTTDGVVTERFAPVQDYIPDAFFKRLILAVEKNEKGEYVSASTNVIVFYYTKNSTSARYAVHYMLQNLGAETGFETDANGNFLHYTESAAYTEGIGTIGQKCEIPPQTFGGFTVLGTALVFEGKTQKEEVYYKNSCFTITVSENGTELYIFYTRKQQEFRVYHLLYGTDIRDLKSLSNDSKELLSPIEIGYDQFGAKVTAAAKQIDGKTCVSAQTQSIVLRANDDQNYIIFYYSPMQTTIEYKVWKYGGGTLDRTLEVFNGEAKAIEGSTATAKDGYIFIGWYLDEACTQSVSDENGTVNGGHLRPNANNLKRIPEVNVFYAKFLPINGSLTITREDGNKDESNGTQVFVYKIQAVNDPDYVIYVTIRGNDSVTINDLPCREYTVMQQNDWSWRYGDPEQNVTVKDDNSAAVTFKDSASKENWLSGNSERISNRKG